MSARWLLPLAILVSTAASSTTIVPMSVEDLSRAATHIEQVRVLESWSAWNPQRTLIYTYSRVQVVRTLKGSHTDTMVVKQLGGSAGGYTQKVSGVRQFQTGEQVLLFLRPSVAGDGTMVIVGLLQGNFRIAEAASGQLLVSNGMPDVHTQNGRIVAYGGPVLTLDTIIVRIRKALQ